MNTEHILAVLRRKRERTYEQHPTSAAAKAARSRASNLLRGVKDRYTEKLLAEGITHDHIANVGAYVDPMDPCRVIVGPGDIARTYGPYGLVARLAVGDSCALPLGRTKLSSVLTRLRQLAVEHEAVMGARPTWRAELDTSLSSRPTAACPAPNNVYRITRLPDDHDPITGKPRAQLTGQRKEEAKLLWERMGRALADYEMGTLYNALVDGRPVPPIPDELRALLAEHDPNELAALQQRVEEAIAGAAQ